MLYRYNRDRSSTLRTGAMQTATRSMSGVRTRKYEIAAAISTRSRKLRIWSRVRDDDVSQMQLARSIAVQKLVSPMRPTDTFYHILSEKCDPSRSKFKRSIL